MSWEATAYVNSIRSGISRSEKLLLLIISNYHNTEQSAAWPSITALSTDSMLCRRQVIRLTKRLIAKNFISVETGDFNRGNNVYRFIGFDTKEPATMDKMSPDKHPATSDILSATSDILDATSDIAMSHNPTIEPTIEPTIGRAPKSSGAISTREAKSRKQPKQNPAVEPWAQIFTQAFEAKKGTPYVRLKEPEADYIQLRRFITNPKVKAWLTPERWRVGVNHYLESTLSAYTLADLATRFSEFWERPKDRYNRPTDVEPQLEHQTDQQRKIRNWEGFS